MRAMSIWTLTALTSQTHDKDKAKNVSCVMEILNFILKTGQDHAPKFD